MEENKATITIIKEKFSEYKKLLLDKEFQKKILSIVNPEPEKGSDYLIDYFLRVLIFLFPLYIYENNAFMGISIKDILFGIAIIFMSIWGIIRILQNGKNRPFSLNNKTLMVFLAFIVILACFIIQVIKLSSEIPHTYLYIGCFLLIFCTGFINRGNRYYMQILSASYIIIYLSIYKYIFTGTATIIGIENLLGTAYKIIPMLLLSCLVNAFLYITEDNDKWQKFYLVLLTAGFVILFLYGDMAAFMIMLFFLMGMQFLRTPTISFMKKNMILLFLYAFCASNAPLLTYFNAQGLNKEFDLEYSIYIDILIAVAGLFITSYWEKLPKDQDADSTLMTRFSKWYKRSILLVLAVVAVAFTFGSKGANLSKGIGGKAISGFTTSLWNAVSNSNGEIWHILTVYGLIGILVLLLLGTLLLLWMVNTWKKEETTEIEKGYIIVALMFIIQGLFYQFSSASTPAFMIFVGLSLCFKDIPAPKVKEEPVSEEIFDIEPSEDDSSVIWVPESVRASMASDKAKEQPQTQNKDFSDETEDIFDIQKSDSKYILAFRRYFPRICSLMLSGFAAVLLMLVIFALYRLFFPVTSLGSTESLVAIAVEERQAELLAQAEAQADEDTLSSAEASSLESIEADEEANDLAKAEANDDANMETTDSVESSEEASAEESIEEEPSEEESEESEESEETDEEVSDEDIPAGISGGDYRIYDPNARYADANDTVTGKNGVVNLRSIPSTSEGSVVVHALEVGETVTRSGIGANGWSMVEYQGQTLYAVSDYLVTYVEPEEAEEAEAEDEAPQEEPAQKASAETSKTPEKPKTPSSYNLQLSTDNKKISIWSAGVLQGTMTVTDTDGNAVQMTNYGDYYQGSGKNQKRYLNIYAVQKEGELTINVDQGFVDAVKGMGYSGLYFNKSVHNW